LGFHLVSPFWVSMTMKILYFYTIAFSHHQNRRSTVHHVTMYQIVVLARENLPQKWNYLQRVTSVGRHKIDSTAVTLQFIIVW
ncbi:hypothetical protein SB57_09465, partial [Lactobacillus delbrueckii subsp. bulgaricus]